MELKVMSTVSRSFGDVKIEPLSNFERKTCEHYALKTLMVCSHFTYLKKIYLETIFVFTTDLGSLGQLVPPDKIVLEADRRAVEQCADGRSHFRRVCS